MIELEFENNLYEALEEAVERANASYAPLEVLSQVDAFVKLRTARGEFLEGSWSGASRYQDRGHIRKRRERGLQTSHVDLFFSGNMLDATRFDVDAGRGDDGAPELTMRYGYIEGLSEAEAIRVANYHDQEGVYGTVRRFVGLTEDEEARLLAWVEDRWGGLIRAEME